ncbi:hypothetical protein DMC47_01660 [Nostoc sp. 3335mG]|nr:hypothetical protein DMC47_01660 [Nostoc sp. 3335mG]
MRHPIPAIAIIVLALGTPAVPAQDFLKPIEDFVTDLVPQRPAPRRAPAPEAPAEAETDASGVPPPVPRPRPEGLGEDAAAEEPDAASEAVDAVADEEDGSSPSPAEAAPEPDVEAPLPDAPPEAGTSAEPAPSPAPEPDRIYQVACPALISGRVSGEMLPPIEEGQCAAQSPLSITALSVGGGTIALSSPLTTNCAVATALADWAGEVDAYARAALDSPLVALETGTGYMCRARVGGDAEFLSEHGFANAVDLTAFVLEDGRRIAVKDDWGKQTTPEGMLLRQSHGAACGRFTTVLGPEANADHEDHLHLDLGCHGQTCTAQICE